MTVKGPLVQVNHIYYFKACGQSSWISAQYLFCMSIMTYKGKLIVFFSSYLRALSKSFHRTCCCPGKLRQLQKSAGVIGSLLSHLCSRAKSNSETNTTVLLRSLVNRTAVFLTTFMNKVLIMFTGSLWQLTFPIQACSLSHPCLGKALCWI